MKNLNSFFFLSFVLCLATMRVASAAVATGTQAPTMIEGKASGALAITYTMCHLAPGNPYNAQTIQVPAAAVPGHRAHGDYLHACIVCSGASTAMSKLGTAPDGPPAEPCELTSRGSALPRLSEVIDGE